MRTARSAGCRRTTPCAQVGPLETMKTLRMMMVTSAKIELTSPRPTSPSTCAAPPSCAGSSSARSCSRWASW
ncbi:MAG: hypothetical protein AVDCRST_MAG69-688 [uncultured Solirubrobacteraceae bacterium]|uniref:Uncharacterized protein n=1 Tax=uncultured Solirubrobacteraceae bacterium TaxID=1162706 RepID=A0A6J4RYB6_9ACTN|nr:MAG: hypothetical protein AVDCRST_MAG69-688 [uncultured Solirubrobacteraceae bacterium]